MFWPPQRPAALLLLLVILPCLASGPPRPMIVAESLLKVFPLGSSVVLPCPVHPDPPSLFHEWFRDGESLDDSYDGRIRVTTTGSLRIRTAQLEDTGRYACRAVNGFGAVTANLTLIVLGPGMSVEDVVLPTPEAAVPLLPPAAPDKELNSTQSADRSPALWEPSVELVQRPVGGSARLRCGPETSPRPPVTWFRNGRELSPSDGRRSRWTLGFQGLTPGDSGNYSCLFRNYSASAVYALQVVDRFHSKPELTGSHPLNTTVQAGDSASFQCRVRSEVPPHIQWLKKVEPTTQDPSFSDGEVVQEGQVIKLHGEFFRVLRSSEVQERPDGSYLNKLLVPEASPQDAGKYLCLGANSLGYSVRSAYLHVLPNPAPSPVNWSHGLFSGSGRSGSFLMAIPVLLGVLVGVLVALVMRCQRRKGAESPPTPRTPICQPPAPATPQRTSGTYGVQDTVGHRINNGSTDTKVTWTSRGGGQQTWSSGSSSLVTDSSLHYPLGCSDPGAYLLLRSNSPYLPSSLCTSEAVLQSTRGNVVSSRLYAPSALFPRLSPPPPHIRDICANGYKNCV